jgi:hypothetical protein
MPGVSRLTGRPIGWALFALGSLAQASLGKPGGRAGGEQKSNYRGLMDIHDRTQTSCPFTAQTGSAVGFLRVLPTAAATVVPFIVTWADSGASPALLVRSQPDGLFCSPSAPGPASWLSGPISFLSEGGSTEEWLVTASSSNTTPPIHTKKMVPKRCLPSRPILRRAEKEMGPCRWVVLVHRTSTMNKRVCFKGEVDDVFIAGLFPARRRLGIPPARLNPRHICGLAVSLPKNPLKDLVSGSSHVLPRGCAKSAVESGVNLGNRGLMRYLPEALEPDPPLGTLPHM